MVLVYECLQCVARDKGRAKNKVNLKKVFKKRIFEKRRTNRIDVNRFLQREAYSRKPLPVRLLE